MIRTLVAALAILSSSAHTEQKRNLAKEAAVSQDYVVVFKKTDERRLTSIRGFEPEHFSRFVDEVKASKHLEGVAMKEMHHVGMLALRQPHEHALAYLSAHHDVAGVYQDGVAYASSLTSLAKEYYRVGDGIKKQNSDVHAMEEDDDEASADADLSTDTDDYSATPWGLDRINQEDLPLDGIIGSGNHKGADVKIYVIDTGLNTRHREFRKPKQRVAENVFDAYSDTLEKNNDVDGHGSHCAGSAAGDRVGVARKADVYGVKVLDDDGSGSYSTVIDGINFVLSQKTANPDWKMVASMSLGGGAYTPVNDAVDSLVQAGVPVAVAAGNDYFDDACDYSPAGAPYAITVGATAIDDSLSYFTNVGSCVNIFGPGTDIYSVCARDNSIAAQIGASCPNRKSFMTISGTSQATPHVAGVIALWHSNDYFGTSSPTYDQVNNALVCTAAVDKLSGVPDGTVNYLLQRPPKDLQEYADCLNAV